MKKIVVFGAGKSATSLIDFLIKTCEENSWHLTVVDGNADLAASKTDNSPFATPVGMNVEDAEQRKSLIEQADIVISLLPPALHILIAKDCVQCGKNLLTASYLDDTMRELQSEIEKKELLFLCEMGLDPGIDHMSAMQLIHRIKNSGGQITSFKSHCGGLVAPESDDNPWHYKISWNPRNVVMAGKKGAKYMENGITIDLSYEELFSTERIVKIPGSFVLSCYPNRDSLPYISLYNLEKIPTFIRTTLRHPDFCRGWKHIIASKLTDETITYNTEGMTLQAFFLQHLDEYLKTLTIIEANHLKQMIRQIRWSIDILKEDETKKEKAIQNLLKPIHPKDELDNLDIEELEQLFDELKEEFDSILEEIQYEMAPDEENFLLINENGIIRNVDIIDLQINAARKLNQQRDLSVIFLKQLFFIGLGDDDTLINKGICSAADILQFAIEEKLALHSGDKDMIVMLHEVEYHKNNDTNYTYYTTSNLVIEGEDHIHTAMAKTVGLPLGIAAKLILQEKITLKGLHIPILPEIYEPVLEGLEKEGIVFKEY